MNLTIPRDRNGELSQQTLPAYKRTNDSLETTIIQLFQKGITMAEISKLIEKMYGHHYTPQTISNMSKLVAEDVLAFKERTLEANYSVIFMDATHIPVKRQTVSKEPKKFLGLLLPQLSLLIFGKKFFKILENVG